VDGSGKTSCPVMSCVEPMGATAIEFSYLFHSLREQASPRMCHVFLIMINYMIMRCDK
jgi:hypothetical protein